MTRPRATTHRTARPGPRSTEGTPQSFPRQPAAESAYRCWRCAASGQDDERRRGRNYARQLLDENPYYTPTSTTPQRFIDMVESIKSGRTTTITTASSQARDAQRGARAHHPHHRGDDTQQRRPQPAGGAGRLRAKHEHHRLQRRHQHRHARHLQQRTGEDTHHAQRPPPEQLLPPTSPPPTSASRSRR